MNKKCISAITAFSLVLSLGHADQVPLEEPVTTEAVADPIVADESTATPQSDPSTNGDVNPATDADEGTPVSHSSNEGEKAAKRTQWKNIALAVGAVAIAVTALILVAHNNGKKTHHEHKKTD
jgi:hypothetical protein